MRHLAAEHQAHSKGLPLPRAGCLAGLGLLAATAISGCSIQHIAVNAVGDALAGSNTVYASDDDTFTLTSAGNSAIGKVVRWVSGTRCVVYFEGVQVRSL